MSDPPWATGASEVGRRNQAGEDEWGRGPHGATPHGRTTTAGDMGKGGAGMRMGGGADVDPGRGPDWRGGGGSVVPASRSAPWATDYELPGGPEHAQHGRRDHLGLQSHPHRRPQQQDGVIHEQPMAGQQPEWRRPQTMAPSWVRGGGEDLIVPSPNQGRKVAFMISGPAFFDREAAPSSLGQAPRSAGQRREMMAGQGGVGQGGARGGGGGQEGARVRGGEEMGVRGGGGGGDGQHARPGNERERHDQPQDHHQPQPQKNHLEAGQRSGELRVGLGRGVKSEGKQPRQSAPSSSGGGAGAHNSGEGRQNSGGDRSGAHNSGGEKSKASTGTRGGTGRGGVVASHLKPWDDGRRARAGGRGAGAVREWDDDRRRQMYGGPEAAMKAAAAWWGFELHSVCRFPSCACAPLGDDEQSSLHDTEVTLSSQAFLTQRSHCMRDALP